MTRTWHPIIDPAQLACLGKLVEELTECASAAARCMIQGIDESKPDTGKVNRFWLEEELADVDAMLSVTMNFLMDAGANRRISQRSIQKSLSKTAWLQALRDGREEHEP